MPDTSTTATSASAAVPAGKAAAVTPAPGSAGRHEREGGHRNEVVVAGRVTAEPYVRELASGDRLTTWRISIARARAQQRPNQSSDPITCVSFQQAIEERTREWRIGDTVQVSGSLRRRFWRSPKGSASVVEIEARAVQRISRCPATPAPPVESSR
ncbi:single-stranded DNA-binding protein [Streptomonospora litoralis]|uniref:Single-stranded DNA-binding protein n=1 Tax=Streptomonospora litoralis TaxID=2498135 RepID=A0A4P6Q490_9ACTN|nr:single-stranded DNA-binding protein [Streptomonospora litoralis]QBI55060.1 Single-stranded DNA-binding protein [Streptomonospora litoralis]